MKHLFKAFQRLDTATLSVLQRNSSPKRSDAKVILLIRKAALVEVLRGSGSNLWYNILLDDSEVPCTSVRPIWLGECTLVDAITRAGQSPKTLGVVRRTLKTLQGEQVTFAVRVFHTDLAELRPIITLNKQDGDYISSRTKFSVGPLPVGLEESQVAATLLQIGWKCRVLVPMPRYPEYWLVAAETEPPVTTVAFDSHDIHIKLLPDRWQKDRVRPSQEETRRFSQSSNPIQDRLAQLESFVQQAIKTNHTAVEDIKHEYSKFRLEQAGTNKHLHACVQALHERLEAVQSEIVTTKDFFKQQLDAFCTTIVTRIDQQQTAFSSGWPGNTEFQDMMHNGNPGKRDGSHLNNAA